MQKKCKKICVCQKNVVLLQPLLKNDKLIVPLWVKK